MADKKWPSYPIPGEGLAVGPNGFFPKTAIQINGLTGFVLHDGSIFQGSGFTASRSVLGVYVVTFNVPFSTRPVVVCTTGQDLIVSAVPIVNGVNTTSFTVSMQNPTAAYGTFVDQSFFFIVIVTQ